MSANSIQSFFDLPVYQDSMEDMLEKHNIEKLIQYERYCRDNGMFEQMEQCYAEDSHVKITWFDGNGREFVRRSAKMASGKNTDPYYLPKHKIYNTFIWLHGDKAIAECQCMMFNYHNIDGTVYNREGFARLLYRVQKINGIWQVESMDCIYERDFMVPVIPGTGKQFNAADFAPYRKSYQCISWMQVVRMILAGVFDRHPNLKIIIGHWGEVVAYYMDRLDEIQQSDTGLNKPVSQYFEDNVYVNPSGMTYDANFRYCLEKFGTDHILWGEDYPYRIPANIRSMLEESDLSNTDKEKIAHGNAERILHLNQQ